MSRVSIANCRSSSVGWLDTLPVMSFMSSVNHWGTGFLGIFCVSALKNSLLLVGFFPPDDLSLPHHVGGYVCFAAVYCEVAMKDELTGLGP